MRRDWMSKRTITINLQDEDETRLSYLMKEKHLEHLGQSQVLRFIIFDYYQLISGDHQQSFSLSPSIETMTESERKAVANRIKHCRQDKSQTYVEWSQSLGASYESVRRWEQGTIPRMNYLKRIESYTGKSIQWILKGEKSNA